MTPRIITYFLCGMRHPTTGLSEGDLSRLTGSSTSSSSSSSSSSASSSASSSSSSSSSSAVNTPDLKDIDGHDQQLQQHVVHPLHTHSPERTPKSSMTTIHKNHLNQTHNGAGGGVSCAGSGKSSTATTTTTTTPTPRFSSTYLPEIINPLEWQKSRKRKERLDSASTTLQERKLQRSNSEELLSEAANVKCTAAAKETAHVAAAAAAAAVAQHEQNVLRQARYDVIRRVSSEDFKRRTYEKDFDELDESGDTEHAVAANSTTAGNENDGSLANLQVAHQMQQQQQQQQQQKQQLPKLPLNITGEATKDLTCHTRYETSPARSHRHSPVRGNAGNVGSGNNGNNGRHRDSDDSEGEHERRRSSERFCKSRLPPGRKAAGITKKSSGIKYLPAKRSDTETVGYKYDLSALKYERRGFISKKSAEKPSSAVSDHNDNSLLDFHQQKRSVDVSPTPTISSAGSDDNTLTNAPIVGGSSASKQAQQAQQAQQAPAANKQNQNQKAPPSSATATAAATAMSTSTSTIAHSASSSSSTTSLTSAQESLPWERAEPCEEPAPILSRRYAHSRHHAGESIDAAAKLAKVMPYPQPLLKQAPIAQMLSDEMDCLEPLDAVRAFSSLENIRTRDVMQQMLPAMLAFQTPEERLKLVNRRITALKKKLVQLEEALEARLGYRPSQAERLNDKYMKNAMAELNKLRKERHELKSDPIAALGLKVTGGMDAAKKLDNMKNTLLEIEQNLTEKRKIGRRSEVLDELTSDQLVQEKTAVQHGLLYFESLYGRPITKDERDAARSLYERYRQLKRLVSRTILFSGVAGAGAPDLPTILEHEAMVFEAMPQQYSSNNSTETTNSPSDPMAPNTTNASSDESTTTTTTTTTAALASRDAAGQQDENISTLSLEQLWEHLDRVREEKKLLRQTIHEYESIFEEQNGRKMLKNDRRTIETYAQYKEKKAKTRLLQALIKKHISH